MSFFVNPSTCQNKYWHINPANISLIDVEGRLALVSWPTMTNENPALTSFFDAGLMSKEVILFGECFGVLFTLTETSFTEIYPGELVLKLDRADLNNYFRGSNQKRLRSL